MNVHTHTLSFSVGSSDNDPSFYQYEVIFCDLTTWETSERRLPAGAVILSSTSLSWAALTKESACDGRLIKLGTFGVTGGRENHNHSVSVTLNSTSPSVAGIPYSDYSAIPNASHSHTGSQTTPDKTTKPARVQTRLYSVSSTTDRVEAGVIAFVDGTPSANWTPVNWNDYFLESVNQNASTTGTSTHDHTGLSITSSTYTRSAGSTGGMSSNTACDNHYHNVSYSLDSQSFLPPYVLLYPVQLNTTLYHINVFTATTVDDLILKRAYNSEMAANARFKAAGFEFITPDVLLQKTVDHGLNHDTMLAARCDASIGHDAILEAWNRRSWLTSLKLIITTASFAASLRLVRPNQTTYPVLDSILKAWTTQLDKIQMRISVMDLSNKLDYATDSEIDLKWGAVYDLHRFADESDEHYRKRIKTYTMIQTGSGTRGVCEAVLDEIVDEPRASRVVTWEPGKVRIYWDSNTAPKVASERWDVIDYTIPMMLAAGIEWTMFLEYVELLIGMHLKGADLIVYYTDLLLQVQDKTFEYYIRPRLMARAIEEMDADTVLKVAFLKTFIVNSSVKKGTDRTISMDELLLKHCAIGTPFDLLERALVTKPYLMRQRLQKFDIDRTIHADALVEKDFKRNVYAILSVVFQIAAEALFDMRLQRYDINKLFLANTVIEKQFDDTAAMDFILVTA